MRRHIDCIDDDGAVAFDVQSICSRSDCVKSGFSAVHHIKVISFGLSFDPGISIHSSHSADSHVAAENALLEDNTAARAHKDSASTSSAASAAPVIRASGSA